MHGVCLTKVIILKHQRNILKSLERHWGLLHSIYDCEVLLYYYFESLWYFYVVLMFKVMLSMVSPLHMITMVDHESNSDRGKEDYSKIKLIKFVRW